MRFLHVNIVARDWRRLSQFYQNVFGCRPLNPQRNYSGEWISSLVGVPDVMIQGEHIECPGYGEGGPTLEIFSYVPKGGMKPLKVNDCGFAHICFEVDDIPGTLRRIVEAGGKIQSTFVEPDAERCIYANDPEGNIIEIHLPMEKKDTYRAM